MKYLFSSILVFVAFIAIAQQINISRVDQMPDFPQPYHMRDWKEVALNYDSLVFDLAAIGQFFPLSSIFENTTNYPEHPALAIQSYVGTNSPPGKEAINILPAVVGATLVGMDKSNQNGINWPLYCEEYFNRRPEENVYLNGPVSSSGNDWWYETMPNIFFYQLKLVATQSYAENRRGSQRFSLRTFATPLCHFALKHFILNVSLKFNFMFF